MIDYLKSAVSTAIDFRGSSPIANGFDLKIKNLKNGIFEVQFIPYIPFDLVIDEALYFKIGQTLAVSLIPKATYLVTPMIIRGIENRDLSSSRALVYKFMKGEVKRIAVLNESIEDSHNKIFLMKNHQGEVINFYDVKTNNNMIGISGISGGGKSYFLKYLILNYKAFNSDVVIIDPKTDEKLAKLKKYTGISYLNPALGKSDLEFLTAIKKQLKDLADEIQKRQHEKLTTKVEHKRIMLVVDELLALTATLDAKDKKEILALLTKIMVTGRASKVGVIVASQQFNADVLPTVCREQLSLKVLLSQSINKQNCAFLFPELDHPEGIFIPDDHINYGKGIIQIVGESVLPFLAPIFISKEE